MDSAFARYSFALERTLSSLSTARLETAERWARQALKESPESPLARLLWAFALRARACSRSAQDRPTALEELRRAVALTEGIEPVPDLLQPFWMRERGASRHLSGRTDGRTLIERGREFARARGWHWEARKCQQLEERYLRPRTAFPTDSLPSRRLQLSRSLFRADSLEELKTRLQAGLQDCFAELDVRVERETDIGAHSSLPSVESLVDGLRLAARPYYPSGASSEDLSWFAFLGGAARSAARAIEQRRVLEEAIEVHRQLRRVWEDAFESSVLGAAVLAGRGRLERANPRFHQILGSSVRTVLRSIPPKLVSTYHKELSYPHGGRVLLTVTRLEAHRKLLLLTSFEGAEEGPWYSLLLRRQRAFQDRLHSELVLPLQDLIQHTDREASQLRALLEDLEDLLADLRHPIFEAHSSEEGLKRALFRCVPSCLLNLQGDWAQVEKVVTLKAAWALTTLLENLLNLPKYAECIAEGPLSLRMVLTDWTRALPSAAPAAEGLAEFQHALELLGGSLEFTPHSVILSFRSSRS